MTIILSFCVLTYSTIANAKIGTIGLSTSSKTVEIRKALGASDAGSLLDVALAWSKFESLNETEQFWIVRLWSPGLAIIEVPLIWLENQIPIFWSLLIITVSLWTYIAYAYWKNLKRNKIRIVFITLFLGMMFSWDFRYMFVDNLFHTEGIGFGLLFLGLTLANLRKPQESDRVSRKKLIVIGIIIGLSIWVRHTSDYGLMFLLVTAFFLSKYFKISRLIIKVTEDKHFLNKVKELKTSISDPYSAEKFVRSNFRQIVAVCLIALAVTLPWRVIGMSLYGNTKPVMSSSFEILGPQLWALPGSEKAVYWDSEGMNWACEIDLKRCKQPSIQSGDADFQLQAAIIAAFSNPKKYLQIRSQDFKNNWIPENSIYPTLHNFIGLLQGFLVFASIYLFLKIRSLERIRTLVLWGSFIFLNLVQLLIIHYESRYFISLRLLIIGLFMNLYIIYESELKKKSKYRLRK
jgi:hypothetical protein